MRTCELMLQWESIFKSQYLRAVNNYQAGIGHPVRSNMCLLEHDLFSASQIESRNST